ncbi:MAG TPA: phosphopantetheine-binding protein [Bryobacteraceae bacterium]|nr:phosphopantetheine-binding protein [Bryobacteraceae bacterium]
MDNRAKIIEIIQTASKRKVWPQPDESLFDSGLLDSFALTDMIGGLEAAFGISVPDSDLSPRKFDTIERIESYLESRR